MDGITVPSIKRLSYRAGVKSMSDDCYDLVRHLINNKTEEIVNASLSVNDEHNTKTLMRDDVIEALHLLNYNITESDDLETTIKG